MVFKTSSMKIIWSDLLLPLAGACTISSHNKRNIYIMSTNILTSPAWVLKFGEFKVIQSNSFLFFSIINDWATSPPNWLPLVATWIFVTVVDIKMDDMSTLDSECMCGNHPFGYPLNQSFYGIQLLIANKKSTDQQRGTLEQQYEFI